MKTFKLTDLAIQVLPILITLILSILHDNYDYLFYLYFIVGGWQLLSFFIHLVIDNGWLNRKERKMYAQTLLWVVIIGLINLLLLTFDVPLIFFYMLAMLFAGPGMAVWYFTIGLRELNTIRRRELIHLK